MERGANCFGLESAGVLQVRGNGCLAMSRERVEFGASARGRLDSIAFVVRDVSGWCQALRVPTSGAPLCEA